MGGSEAPRVAMSEAQAAYFAGLDAAAQGVLEVAKAARRKGLDPTLDVEIPLAEDLAARVEEQVQIRGVAARIRELTKEHPSRELVSLHCAKEVASGRFQAWPSPAMALEKAVRTGLSILTEGILVAPLEGIAKVLLGQNQDGTGYVDLYFAGPIRAAGGTAQAMSVLIADVVRRELGIGRFVATQAEIERYKEEVPAYKRAQHLQYAPSGDEVEHIVRHCPVCINGEGTEQEEVTGHRNLPRVETNQLRGGAVLVLAEGLTQKAPKIMKIVEKLKLPDWDFLNAFVKKAPAQDAGGSDQVGEIEASDKFIKELIGGRPVLAHPSRIGGFRLRYGRSRTAGLASTSVSPIAMHVLDDFLAVGTQMKIERPGKGTIATPCSGLEGPILLLRNGDLVQPATVEEFRVLGAANAMITDLGEILIPFGEFNENNAILPDASFTYEWWREELRAVAGPGVPAPEAPTFSEAVALSRTHGIPLHPRHNLFWHDLDWTGYTRLCRSLLFATPRQEALAVPKDPRTKEALVALGALHREEEDAYVLAERWEALLAGCGLRTQDGKILAAIDLDAHLAAAPAGRFPLVQAAGRAAGVLIKPRAPTRIGARMGRPEKADKRVMDPPVHVLFPVGHEGGTQRSLEEAAEKGKIQVKVGIRRCKDCGREAYLVRCSCGARTEPTGAPAQERDLPVRDELRAALDRLKVKQPKKLKGVQGLVSQAKLPEPIDKGILRAIHDLWVFKDGTIRFDATDAPLTHFTPHEVGTSVPRLHALGYAVDAKGVPLERADQVVELRVQDVVLPASAGEYFVATARFVDDLLERFYGLPPFYNVQEAGDLVGHLIAGLAPHTSGAVLGRIAGFTKASVGYAHPFYHAAKRRNADGDEDAFMLLLDAFLNFSRSFIPDRRGGLMDLPLVLATRIDPSEIDKEAHNVDVGWSYPLEFYRATEQHRPAKEVAGKMQLVAQRIGTPAQFEGFGYTVESRSIHEGPVASAYKTLGSMPEKMAAQLSLADRLRAVDAADVATRVISHHLLPDLIGNLKAFAKQSVRCTKCNTKYRRIPVGGKCMRVLQNGRDMCENPLTLTVHQASVRKYLDLCLDLCQRYEIPAYTRQHIDLVKKFIDDTFRVRDVKLTAFG